MAFNPSIMVYLPNYDFFSRTVVITPIASQPGAPAYTNRGIFDTRGLEVLAADGSIVSDQQTILDIRESEYDVQPQQYDHVMIPAEEALEALGPFEIVNKWTNGGGETTLVLRDLLAPAP